MMILRWMEKSLPGRAHRANVVHQLLVLHETATTEVTGARVSLNGRLLLRWRSKQPDGGGEEGGRDEGPPDEGETRRGKIVRLCRIAAGLVVIFLLLFDAHLKERSKELRTDSLLLLLPGGRLRFLLLSHLLSSS